MAKKDIIAIGGSAGSSAARGRTKPGTGAARAGAQGAWDVVKPSAQARNRRPRRKRTARSRRQTGADTDANGDRRKLNPRSLNALSLAAGEAGSLALLTLRNNG